LIEYSEEVTPTLSLAAPQLSVAVVAVTALNAGVPGAPGGVVSGGDPVVKDPVPLGPLVAR
jgi:hypothetical protein